MGPAPVLEQQGPRLLPETKPVPRRPLNCTDPPTVWATRPRGRATPPPRKRGWFLRGNGCYSGPARGPSTRWVVKLTSFESGQPSDARFPYVLGGRGRGSATANGRAASKAAWAKATGVTIAAIDEKGLGRGAPRRASGPGRSPRGFPHQRGGRANWPHREDRLESRGYARPAQGFRGHPFLEAGGLDRRPSFAGRRGTGL